MTTALSTPGWFGEHAAMMRRFGHHTFATALVPTEAVGRVVHSRWSGHEEIRFSLPEHDLAALRRGLAMTARAYFAAGARRVYLPTDDVHVLDHPDRVDRIDRVMTSPKRFHLGSAHPQGGVPLSEDPDVGAVNRDFALHGFENLFVCDASVFPTSVGVNPLETVMGLAMYAAPRISGRTFELAHLDEGHRRLTSGDLRALVGEPDIALQLEVSRARRRREHLGRLTALSAERLQDVACLVDVPRSQRVTSTLKLAPEILLVESVHDVQMGSALVFLIKARCVRTRGWRDGSSPSAASARSRIESTWHMDG